MTIKKIGEILNPKKVPGSELLTAVILKELPKKGLSYLQIY